jgi:hypothetical protein
MDQETTTVSYDAQENKPERKFRWWLILLILLFVIGILIFIIYYNRQQSVKSSTANETNEEQFAVYQEVKSTVTPAIKPYTLKSSELSNLTAVEKASTLQFPSSLLSLLEKPGFFVHPTKPMMTDPNTMLTKGGNRSDDMVDLYENFGGDTHPWERKPENAVFVTSDFLIHIYHVLIDRTFQKTEEVKFQPILTQLTEELYKNAISKYNQEQNPQFKDSWKRLTVFYLVPQVLLQSSVAKPKDYFSMPAEEQAYLADDAKADTLASVQANLQKYQNIIPPEIYQLASQELTLVVQGTAFNVSSPLYGSLKPNTTEDYTQYTPRSHYTRNSVLRSYFRAMMWYGRQNFEVKSLDLTRDAMLMTWQLNSDAVNGNPALTSWKDIYLPTVFFVGKSDDLTVYDYSDLMNKIYGKNPLYQAITNSAKLSTFQAQAKKLQGPKILSEVKILNPTNLPTKDALLQDTKGFRFMGQRFIPDSYMFSMLTQGDEQPDKETGQRLPSTPTALMIMSILGSKTADSLLNDWVKTNAPNSDKVIAKVKKQLTNEVASYNEQTWTQNIYWAWLYNLRPLFADYTNGYPMFMTGLPWSEKSLLTALGSWTELRHDTLLYAKQSYAELGGGGEMLTSPPVPKGYVEPNLSFMTRLIALATMTRDGLNSRGLLVPGQKEKFDSYLTSLQFFKSIVEKELSNASISDDDYEKLRTIISLNYPDIVWTPDGDEMTEQDARTGIIADVHTDAKKGQILYEATGVPSIIYVSIKDQGGVRLTRGVTYSYYEFTQPVGKRLTDQDWQGMVYDGKNTANMPASPIWTKNFIK